MLTSRSSVTVADAWVDTFTRLGIAADAEPVPTRSGAVLLFGEDVVVKVHREGTDGEALAARLHLAGEIPELVTPVSSRPIALPPEPLSPWGTSGWASVWPRAETLAPDSAPQDLPWAPSGTLLSRLHARANAAGTGRAAFGERLQSGGPARCRRAVATLARCPDPRAQVVLHAAWTLSPPEVVLGGSRLVHGDWHLGQLGRMPGERTWRLLDVDDLGGGSPAGDLGRVAAFRAVGLLPDSAWEALVEGYRAGPGEALPPTGPVWPAVDGPARWAVVVAATGLLADALPPGTSASPGKESGVRTGFSGSPGKPGTSETPEALEAEEALTAFVHACHRMLAEARLTVES